MTASTMTREQAERLISTNNRLIAGDDEDAERLDLYERVMSEVGDCLGTGEPGAQFSEEFIDDLGGDYICALDDGAILAWGTDAGRFYVTGQGDYYLRDMNIYDSDYSK